jgi:hypothetical protein
MGLLAIFFCRPSLAPSSFVLSGATPARTRPEDPPSAWRRRGCCGFRRPAEPVERARGISEEGVLSAATACGTASLGMATGSETLPLLGAAPPAASRSAAYGGGGGAGGADAWLTRFAPPPAGGFVVVGGGQIHRTGGAFSLRRQVATALQRGFRCRPSSELRIASSSCPRRLGEDYDGAFTTRGERRIVFTPPACRALAPSAPPLMHRPRRGARSPESNSERVATTASAGCG